ncbi:MAG: rebG 2 [Myxococcaceae bacterium]|nr:rebG 2 [Myxococcaceae bacterium]
MSSSNRHHTYLFALVDGGGTVPPELGAVRRLIERGHQVTVLAEDSMEDDVRVTGAAFVRWQSAPNRRTRRHEDDRLPDYACKSPFELFEVMLERQLVGPAAHYVADVRAQIARRRPELVVCSFFALGAMLAAEAEGIPFDVLLPNAYLLPAQGMPPMGLGLRPATNKLGELLHRLLGAFNDMLWNKGLARFNELRTALGLAPLETLFAQFGRARRQLVLTSSSFDFAATLPPQARYVGPVLDDPAWAASGWEQTADSDAAPLVLVALSSTYQRQSECLQRIVDGLGRLPVRGLVTTGPALDPSTIRARANVRVVSSAPHSAVLRQAAAVVTHGGHGTVIRSLAAGVPLAILPHGRDQADNAARVTSRGAGLSLPRAASPKRIAHAVTRLLDDASYRTAARRLGDDIVREAASGLLIAELEELPGSLHAEPN